MKTINTQDLHDLVTSGDVALFDVRGDIDYEIAHIPGAHTAPLGSLVFRVADLMKPDSRVIVYSAGGDCTLAAQAAHRLENLGLTNVVCYEEGLAGWQAAGHVAVPSVNAKVVTQGEYLNVRSLVVDRDRAYGGAFRGRPADTSVAGG